MGLKGAALAVLRRLPGLRLAVRKGLRVLRGGLYRLRTRKIAPDRHTVLFCSYHGKSCTCSPRAIYDYMRTSPAYRNYRFLWAVQDVDAHRYLEESPRTQVVPFGGRAFEAALAGAGYWVFNITLPEHISPRAGQTYLQCWHGTPLKRLGYDITEEGGNAMNSLREIRRKYRLEGEKVDYFLSPSPFASRCFRSAWQLDRWGKGDALLEAGYPRNDRLVNATERDCLAARAKLGLAPDQRVILYAPTFRDDQHTGGGYAFRSPINFAALQAALGENYVVLFRAHYLVASQFDFSAYSGFVRDVSGVEEINDLYLAADLLITDYSSTMFDFACRKRPILFYMYDLEAYRDRLRGFYFDLNELPGPILTQEAELLPAIRAAEHFVWTAEWEAFRQRFAPLEDGQAARRVTEAVIGKGD